MAFRLKYSQSGPSFLAGLRVRTLLKVELWRRLNNRWHGARMGRYGARHRPHTCPEGLAEKANQGNPDFRFDRPCGLQMSEKCHDARVNIIPHISAVQASVAVKLLRHRANMYISYPVPEYRHDIHVGAQGDPGPAGGVFWRQHLGG